MVKGIVSGSLDGLTIMNIKNSETGYKMKSAGTIKKLMEETKLEHILTNSEK